MQSVNGYLSNGRFTPSDEISLPSYARVKLVIEEVLMSKSNELQRQARIDGLKQIEAALELINDEDLSDFPKQGLMKLPQDYALFE